MSPSNSPKSAAAEELKEETSAEVESSKPLEDSGADDEQAQSPKSSSDSGSGDDTPTKDEASSAIGSTPQWQAVWAPQYNAYYFYNPLTQETTWANPLQPEASGSSVPSAETVQDSSSSTNDADEDSTTDAPVAGPSTVSSQYAALQAAAAAQGIDPLLAHLDPSLRNSIQGTSGAPGDVPTFTAQFNAHTGKFAPASSRTTDHMSEYERAKRMSQFYFDVNQWEEQVAEDKADEAANGKKRKRPTKKDLERYKEQKKAKKIAKTAWLRS